MKIGVAESAYRCIACAEPMREYRFAGETPFTVDHVVIGCQICGLHLLAGEIDEAVRNGTISIRAATPIQTDPSVLLNKGAGHL